MRVCLRYAYLMFGEINDTPNETLVPKRLPSKPARQKRSGFQSIVFETEYHA